MSIKIGRNQPCPCGRLAKYKECCERRVDWERIYRTRSTSELVRNLSPRGRNIRFLAEIAAALQMDELGAPRDWATFKKAFTPAAVRQIHEAVINLWPPDSDLSAIFQSDPDSVRALYVGEYEPDSLARGVARHSVYADVITLMDPFPYAYYMRPEYSPLEYPEHFMSVTLQCTQIWFQFIPWIEKGLIEFTRTPADFDIRLWREAASLDKQRYKASPELSQLVREWVEAKMDSQEVDDLRRHTALHFPPDDYLKRTMHKLNPGVSEQVITSAMERIREERDQSRYYIPPVPDKDGNVAELRMMSSGMGHTESRLAAALMGGYLVTDMRPRWRMIEMDREYEQVDSAPWSPLAKAFGNARLKYLDRIGLDDALRVREEDRLAHLRGFLRSIWNVTAGMHESAYAEGIAVDMAAELDQEVRDAEAVWNEIDRDLLKWFSGDVLIGATGAIATGGAAWLGAGVAGAAAIQLGVATWKRRDFHRTHPAAFFIDLRKKDD